jgi:hypothetical protein
MTIVRCPGLDKRNWKPGDIYEVSCPFCGARIEFFKDDIVRKCGKCRKEVFNPGLNLGCLAWCRHADKCREILLNNQKKGEQQ